MNKRIIIIAFGILLGIGFFMYQMNIFGENIQDEMIETKTETTLKDGRWVLEDDTYSGIQIKNGKWSFSYEGTETSEDDFYDITITNELPKYADTDARPGKFIVLTNKRDTLNYEILNKNDSILSLMYFPNGSIHLYVPEKED